MKTITSKEFQEYLKGKKTKNWKIIRDLLKGGGKQYDKQRRAL